DRHDVLCAIAVKIRSSQQMDQTIEITGIWRHRALPACLAGDCVKGAHAAVLILRVEIGDHDLGASIPVQVCVQGPGASPVILFAYGESVTVPNFREPEALTCQSGKSGKR